MRDPAAKLDFLSALLVRMSVMEIGDVRVLGSTNETEARFGPDTRFVVYCNGPHCNGADRRAAKLAGLGRKVKKMIGGVEGWKDDGFNLVEGSEDATLIPKRVYEESA